MKNKKENNEKNKKKSKINPNLDQYHTPDPYPTTDA